MHGDCRSLGAELGVNHVASALCETYDWGVVLPPFGMFPLVVGS